MKAAHFPPRARLHISAEYQAVFTAGKRLSSAHLRMFAQPRLDTVEARLGITVSKRVDKRAVARNRFKRRIREFFRQQRCRLPAGDYVLIVKPEARQLDAAALGRELEQLFDRASALKPTRPAGTMPPSAVAPLPPASLD